MSDTNPVPDQALNDDKASVVVTGKGNGAAEPGSLERSHDPEAFATGNETAELNPPEPNHSPEASTAGDGPATKLDSTTTDDDVEPNRLNVTSLRQEKSLPPPSGQKNRNEKAVLDEFERLAADTILDDDEGEEPGAKDEVTTPLVVKKLPRFANFRASPQTFDLWGTTDQQGMDDLLYTTTKSFAPQFENDVELRRFRFFETVSSDGVVRLVWCPVPEKDGRPANHWVTSKLAALVHAQSQWTTMRSRSKLGQYTYRASAKPAEYGEPRFSGRSPAQWIVELKKLGMLVDSKDHEFYRKATDS